MSLRRPESTHRIALTLSMDDLHMMQELTLGVKAEARRRPALWVDDFYPLTRDYDGSYHRRRQQIHYDGQVSGVDMVSIERIRRMRLPLVLVEGASLLVEHPWVGPDYAAIGRMAVKYFQRRGYSQLVFFHTRSPLAPQVDLMRVASIASAETEGVSLTCFEHGARCARAERVRADDQIADLGDQLKGMPKPVGIFACDDVHAWRARMACEQAGLDVPHAVAILGVGNDPFICESGRPALSSVGIHYRRIGAEALRLLGEWLEHGIEPPLRTLMDVAYVETRESTELVRSDNPVVRRAVAFIREHLGEKMDLDRVAREAGTSRRSLIRSFHQDLGRNPGQVLRDLRLEMAVHDLKASEKPISAVAADCGFTDQSHLTRVIKEHMGMTPLELRR
jgi:LacI family transcriptional regulator